MNRLDLRSAALRSAGLSTLPTDRLAWTDVDRFIETEVQKARVILSQTGNESVSASAVYPIVAGTSLLDTVAFQASRWLHLKRVALRWTSALTRGVRARHLVREEFLEALEGRDAYNAPTSAEPAWSIVGSDSNVIGIIEIAPTPSISYAQGIEILGVQEALIASDSTEIPLPLTAQDDFARMVGKWIVGRLEETR